uniref:ATP-binding protein n=1 Tax=Paenibacillus gorillae TaxID=1243662 RepID=UPI0005AB662F
AAHCRDRAARSATRREQLQQSLLELGNRLQRLRAAAEERRAAAEEAARQRDTAASAWRGWLEALALPQAMSPDAALEVFELVEQALQRLAQRERRAAKYAAAGRQLAAFEAQAAELCASLPEAARASPPLSLRLLQAELRRQEAARQEAARLGERLAELNLAIRDASVRIDSANAEMAELVRQARMESAAEFAAALSHRPRLASIDTQLNRLTIELTAGLSEQRFAELELLLESHDEVELRQLHAEAVGSHENGERMKTEKLDARGRMRQQLEQLLQEDEGRRLLADKEMTIAQLEQDGDRYAVLAVSASLIRATKRIYEEERQPEVLRLASEYIRELTEGRYVRVMTTPGDPAIRLETVDKRFVPTDRLSRGTAEQVYLAMRLALAEEAAHRQRLPMLLDDLFVNFDRPRLIAAAGLMKRLTESRQILLFSCHDHIRDLLTGLMPQAALIQLER